MYLANFGTYLFFVGYQKASLSDVNQPLIHETWCQFDILWFENKTQTLVPYLFLLLEPTSASGNFVEVNKSQPDDPTRLCGNENWLMHACSKLGSLYFVHVYEKSLHTNVPVKDTQE